MSESMWQSWSIFGRDRAEKALGSKLPDRGVLATTNHLVFFNSLLKRKYLANHQFNGHRLRIDILVHLFITIIIPSLFASSRLRRLDSDRTRTLLKQLLGGDAFLLNFSKRPPTPLSLLVSIFSPTECRILRGMPKLGL